LPKRANDDFNEAFTASTIKNKSGHF
jgi:hypothetical protein